MAKLLNVSMTAGERECFNCFEPCDDDDYCYGCGAYVCEACASVVDVPWGEHAPEDHLSDDNVEV